MVPQVLAYHKVGTPELGGTWCTRRQLRGHLRGLQRSGWRAIDAAAFERALGGDGPERAVLVTFDDAFASFATHAWPELRAGGVPALLFVVSAYVGRPATWDLPLPGRRVAHLDWAALAGLAQDGVAIGSHAATHRDLRRLDDRALRDELAGSRRELEDRLGVAVHAVAYPFGRHDARVRGAARAAGYTLGFGTWMPAGPLDRLAVPRHGVYVIDAARDVLAKLDTKAPTHRLQRLAARTIHACATLATLGNPPSVREP